ncbi:NAD(P)/FAD-dependent oxidoreductase [Candidatus Chloroploca sp. M-50]|uniref:NAD(P)/FAD-dependent oxidoreductase n=1 Tax=Candidatus Chloroploca mongolica TaxID=2528176 RepID=A0ABS4DBL0_9CHLR|nr:NAD(P)/FAD-dependent oxidoreductase [Candidatus Chloroploca mongolica]MBP1466831.1 NAD(P)/FAD-dependent oxidoreductase [Candidatus Chloroploca mongolica]
MVDVIGGGILGLTLAYELLKQGQSVRVWERSATLGGLMGRTSFPELGNMSCDRYYHAILNSDRTLMGLMDEVKLRDRLQMVSTKMGFYHDGRSYPMTTPLEFLRFPPLTFVDRARLAYTILACRQVKDWRQLEQMPVAEWLTGLSGERTVRHIWEPLLRAKFDGDFSQVPATYIWSRLVRTTDTRSKGKELMCYLPNGYQELVDALANAVSTRGGTITTGATVDQIRVVGDRVVGLSVNGQELSSDKTVITMQTPIARRLLPPEAANVSARWGQLEGYLGIVCMLLVMRRSLTPYYTLNITDQRIPFTGVIETTNLIDPRDAGGYHLVYLPKYVAPGSPYARMGDEELQTTFLGYLRQMFPDLRDDDIAAIRIGRERYVEPLHPIGATDLIPPVASAVTGLYLANTGQIYPQLTNGESVCAFARGVAARVAGQQINASAVGAIALTAAS